MLLCSRVFRLKVPQMKINVFIYYWNANQEKVFQILRFISNDVVQLGTEVHKSCTQVTSYLFVYTLKLKAALQFCVYVFLELLQFYFTSFYQVFVVIMQILAFQIRLMPFALLITVGFESEHIYQIFLLKPD